MPTLKPTPKGSTALVLPSASNFKITATVALKFTQHMCTIFSIGMLFFPLKMMEGEHAFTSSHVAALH